MNELQSGAPFKKPRRDTRYPSWMLWVAATSIGYGLGMTLSSYLLSSTLRPLGPVLWGVLNVLIYGAVIGTVLGIFQFMVLPRGSVPFHRLVLATLAGAAIGFSLASVVCEMLANSMDPTENIVLGRGIISAVAGLIIGSATGFGQWLVLQHHLPRMREWIGTTVLGTFLGIVIAAALVGLLELPLLLAFPSSAVGAIMGIVIGISQGLVLRSRWR
jgi:hypothetical protein